MLHIDIRLMRVSILARLYYHCIVSNYTKGGGGKKRGARNRAIKFYNKIHRTVQTVTLLFYRENSIDKINLKKNLYKLSIFHHIDLHRNNATLDNVYYRQA